MSGITNVKYVREELTISLLADVFGSASELSRLVLKGRSVCEINLTGSLSFKRDNLHVGSLSKTPSE